MVEVVVVSSDDGMEAEDRKMNSDGEGVVRWEKYLPKMVLRVLLVEADDSTRQIIASLLRKCNYRVVAVPDGLTAWETLKAGPQNVDLVLTELDLPSISGFALLTLVMEHESCKNIPVIMMSAEDSFSMVLKCMLRGAGDYLIKPVRKNELRNLWQHVWRRHALHAGPVHHSLPVSQPKLEATADNSADCRDYLTSTKKNANNKGGDAQSSCSSRFKESESEYVPDTQGLSRATLGDGRISQPEGRIVPMGERDGSKDLGRHADNSISFHGLSEKKFESSNMTMDLIRTFDERPNCSYGDNSSTEHVSPELELSLKRFCPSSSRDQNERLRQKLCRSNNSAFSQYDNGEPVVAAAASSSSEPKTSTESCEHLKMVSSDMRSVTTSCNQENIGSCISGQYGQAELSCDNQVLQSVVFPVSGVSQPVRVTHQTKQLRDSPFPANTTVPDPDLRQSEETMNCWTEPNSRKASEEVEFGCQSTCTNSCDDGVAGQSSSSEKLKEEQDALRGATDTQRWSQRKAALTKFRMKRKDRCFEKKVLYQSRKKLAEQRPRVRGQFVRAVNYEIPAPDVSHGP